MYEKLFYMLFFWQFWGTEKPARARKCRQSLPLPESLLRMRNVLQRERRST
jgi:hypothetical protein